MQKQVQSPLHWADDAVKQTGGPMVGCLLTEAYASGINLATVY